MARRSMFEDRLLVSSLYLHAEMPSWGMADISDASALITDGPVIESHVITRALRKFRKEEWITAERDPDTSQGPRYLYRLTAEHGVSAALAGAGRELANGERYPIDVIAKFAGMKAVQEPAQ